MSASRQRVDGISHFLEGASVDTPKSWSCGCATSPLRPRSMAEEIFGFKGNSRDLCVPGQRLFACAMPLAPFDRDRLSPRASTAGGIGLAPPDLVTASSGLLMQSILPASSGPAVFSTRRSGRIPHRSLATYPSVLAWLATRPSFCVVQIGANSGDTPEDPLYRFLREELRDVTPERRDRTHVVLVEPVREYFDRLQEAYAGLPCVRFENVAIAETRDSRQFYRLDADPTAHGYPAWSGTRLSASGSDDEPVGALREKAWRRDLRGDEAVLRGAPRDRVGAASPFRTSSSVTGSKTSTCCRSTRKGMTTGSCRRLISIGCDPRSSTTSGCSSRMTRPPAGA